MNRKLSLIILVLVCFQSGSLFAQRYTRCGTVEYMKRLKAQDQDLDKRMKNAELLIQKANEENQQRTSDANVVITVPLVFHILYHSSADTISNNRIIDQVATLNKDFARLNSDTNNTPVAFRSVSANTQIQFCLAKRDPNGDSTNGIIKTFVTADGFDPLSGDSAKFTAQGGADAWPASQYLNIWVVTFNGASGPFGINLLGTTTLPGGDPLVDGVMVLNKAVGGNTYHGTLPKYNLGRTLTHEIGHWFFLIHPWGDDATGSCAGSDSVADTPNQENEIYDCPPFFPQTDACSFSVPGIMYMNYMDYVDDNCMNMFTQGQSTRMHDAITAFRATIPFSNGCVAPTGISEMNASVARLNLFPNPASGSITVSSEFTGLTDVTITVSDMLGDVIYSRELKNVSHIDIPVDLSDKSQGVYNFSLRTATALVNRKIVLAH